MNSSELEIRPRPAFATFPLPAGLELRPAPRPPQEPRPAPFRKTRYLQPGQLVACTEPTTVVTILGSCVAVCLWDRRRGVGAVNHFLLPHWTSRRELSPRFGPVAVAQLIERAYALGWTDLQAKLFGGARVLASPGTENHVGALNVRVARERLAAAGIPIVAEDVGGDRGRRLVFHTDTGIALVRKL